MDLNYCRQVKDKWGFRVSTQQPSHPSTNKISSKLIFCSKKMTARLPMYAELYTKASKPDYKPQVVSEKERPRED